MTGTNMRSILFPSTQSSSNVHMGGGIGRKMHGYLTDVVSNMLVQKYGHVFLFYMWFACN